MGAFTPDISPTEKALTSALFTITWGKKVSRDVQTVTITTRLPVQISIGYIASLV